jgi:hypothetical protein
LSCNCAGVDQSACASNVSTAYKLVGFDTSQNYTTDSVNQCVGDIGALSCPPAGAACEFTVPKSCPGQGATLPILTTPGGDAGSGDGG